MRKLTKPKELPGDIFNLCISKVRNINLKKNLKACEATVVAASNELERKVKDAKLHTILASSNVAGIVTGEEMRKVYTDRMVGQTSPGRDFYNKLMLLPVHGRCPLCGQRNVSTLDHHLPKAHFPSLVVAPLNLIPSCKDCNSEKSDNIPITGDDETLHPYFDNVEDEVWLFAKVIEKSPVSVIFYVCTPNHWDNQLSKRVKQHFKIFKLAELYGPYAAEEITSIISSVDGLFTSGGAELVREFIKLSADGKAKVHKNSWQTALYTCLSDSDWFCNGGYKI